MRQVRLSWVESTQQRPDAASVDMRKGDTNAHAAATRPSAMSRGKSTGTAWSDGSQSYESDAAESVTASEADRIAAEYESRQEAEEMDEQVQEALLEAHQERRQDAGMEVLQGTPDETVAGPAGQERQEADEGEGGAQQPPQQSAAPENEGDEGGQQQVQLAQPQQEVTRGPTNAARETQRNPPSLPPLQPEEGSPTGISDAFGNLDAEREGDEISLSRPVLPRPAAAVGGRGRGAEPSPRIAAIAAPSPRLPPAGTSRPSGGGAQSSRLAVQAIQGLTGAQGEQQRGPLDGWVTMQRTTPNPRPQRAGFSGEQLESMQQKQLNRAGKMKQTQQQQQQAEQRRASTTTSDATRDGRGGVRGKGSGEAVKPARVGAGGGAGALPRGVGPWPPPQPPPTLRGPLIRPPPARPAPAPPHGPSA